MFHAVFLITIGSLLLSNNFGYIPWSIWDNLISYWPVLIIFIGIDIVLGKSSLGNLIAGVINSLIFLLIVAKVIGYSLPFKNPIPLPQKNYEVPQFFFTERSTRYYFN